MRPVPSELLSALLAVLLVGCTNIPTPPPQGGLSIDTVVTDDSLHLLSFNTWLLGSPGSVSPATRRKALVSELPDCDIASGSNIRPCPSRKLHPRDPPWFGPHVHSTRWHQWAVPPDQVTPAQGTSPIFFTSKPCVLWRQMRGWALGWSLRRGRATSTLDRR